jgi:transcriptional pleiotropic regulator of transition state genes
VPGAFVRQIDELGRVVIPAEVRSRFGLIDGSTLEFFLDGEHIVLGVYRPGCVFCGAVERLQLLRDRPLCQSCGVEAARLFSVTLEMPAVRQGYRGRPPSGETLRRLEGPTARHLVGQELRANGWQVDDSGRAGKSVDLVASKGSRTWYLQVRPYRGDEPEWPSGCDRPR